MKQKILIVSLTLFIACKKESIIFNNTKEVVDNSNNNSFFYPKPNISFFNFLSNHLQTDAEDKNIDFALYYLGNAINEVLLDQTSYNSFTFKLEEYNNKLSLDKLIEDTSIFRKLNLALSKYNLDYVSIKSNMIRKNISYFPILEFANPNCELNLVETRPILCVGVNYSINSTNLDSMQEYILGWQYTGDTFDEILISESIRDSTTKPILILSCATNYVSQINYDNPLVYSINLNKESISKSMSVSADIKKLEYTGFRINERYETSTHSEYWYTGANYYNGSIYGWGTGYLIEYIHKRDVNKDIVPRNGKFTIYGVEAEGYIQSYILTFERDWYASNKVVLFNTPTAQELVNCRMKYANEFYQKVISNKNTHLRYNGTGFIDVKNPNL